MSDRAKHKRLRLIGAAVALCAGPDAPGGTLRHDVPDSSYVALASDSWFEPVGVLVAPGGSFVGTLIDPRWVVTAAHVVDTNSDGNVADETAGSFNFSIGSLSSVGAGLSAAAGWNGSLNFGNDLALIRLAAPIVSLTPAEPYPVLADSTRERDMSVTLVGFGATGSGQTGPTLVDGLKRAGQNMVDRYAIFGATISHSTNPSGGLLWDFDDPAGVASNSFGESIPLPLEMIAAAGDDGAPAFILSNGRQLLAGVHSTTLDKFAYPGAGNDVGTYGDWNLATRVSQHIDYIEDTVANRWTNPAGGTLGDAGNWSEAAAPGPAEIAAFYLPGSYTVSLAGDTTHRKLLVRSGNVTLDLGGHAYSLTAQNGYGAVTVGRTSGDSATLTIQNGTLNSTDAILGTKSGSAAHVTLDAGATWNVGDYLGIGAARGGVSVGLATLQINNGGALHVSGSIEIGLGGHLILNGQGFSVPNLTVRGSDLDTVIGDGTSELIVTGSDGYWSRGEIGGGAIVRIAPGAQWALRPGSGRRLDGGTIINDGTFVADLYKSSTAVDNFLIRDALIENNGTMVILGSQGSQWGAASNNPPATLRNRGVLDVYNNTWMSGSTNSSNLTFDNSGILNILAGRLRIEGLVVQHVGNALNGGAWNVFNRELIINSGSAIMTLGPAATVRLDGASATFAKLDTLADNQGRFAITGGKDFTTLGDLSNSGLLTIGPGSTMHVVGDLTNTGSIDLGGTLIVDGGAGEGMSLDDLAAQVLSGFNGGSWDGPGIFSTTAAARQSSGHPTAVGYLEDAGTIYLRHTWTGDADLNGLVNKADLTYLANNWQQAGEWYEGDFNYDHVVDLRDLYLMALNWQLDEGPLEQLLAASSLPAVSIPEPAPIGLLGGWGAWSLKRRRQRG